MARGVSLIETIFAISLLSGALLVVAALMDWGLGLSRDSRMSGQAALVGRARLAKLRLDLSDFNNFRNFSSLSTGRQAADKFPGFSTQVTLGAFPTYTPYNATELAFDDPADRKPVDSSLVQANVTVFWGRRSMELTTVVAEPRRRWGNLSISPGGATVNSDTTASFTVTATDDSGATLNDIVLRWGIRPGTTTGTVGQNRRGSVGNFTAHYPRYGGLPNENVPSKNGTCYVTCTGRLWGVEKTAEIPVTVTGGPP